MHIFATIQLQPNKTRLHLVWNRGLYVQGYSPTIHPTAAADLRSTLTIDVASGATSAALSTTAVMKSAHATLNSLSWGFLIPLGALTARYLRQVHSVGPKWFYVHATIQLLGFLLGAAGFGLGLRLGAVSAGVEYGLHRKLGVAAFSMGAVQTVALLFRPKTTNKFRKYWKSYHHFVGYGCVVVGVVNVLEGFEVMGWGRSYMKLAYCLAVSTLVGGAVALEVNSWVVFCRKAKEEKMKREGMEGGGYDNKGRDADII